MTKEELIDCICDINIKAKREHLRRFSEEQLAQYLSTLMERELKNTAGQDLLQIE